MKRYFPHIAALALCAIGLWLAAEGAAFAGCCTFAAGVYWWKESR